jgi:hypothetical protein
VLAPLIAALAYAGAAFLFGIAMGERGELGVVQYVFMAVIPATTIVLTAVARQARFEVMLTGAAMLAGLLLGQRAFRVAYDECAAKGPTVAAALVHHRAKHDDYPSRLEELDVDLPCDCILRDTILHYLSNERAFKLWITNDAQTVTFTANGRSASRSPTTRSPTR